ncbi:MAG: endonuclease [Bacteroidales bacterium]|jgi:endonuclease I|nr:endonuclease [Bacteroidales bacterium]
MFIFYKRFVFTMAGILSAILATAQIPAGYYDSAEGIYGESLQQALHNIIDNHNSLSYEDLWSAFEDTDPRPDNSNLVWDMYSDVPGGTPSYYYTFGSDQCGNYSGEGSCYNREHSWPKSWFNDESPMYSDLVQLVPSDGYTNGQRSNFVYGEVSSASWTSTNGSKKGSSALSWTNETVFEPIDEYKGDFARIYFYMATRYYGEDGSFNSNDMVDGSQLKPGALAMLMTWHEEDPVSEKEQNRNNAIYDWQYNRNPYVDNPEFVEYVWGDPPNASVQSNLQDAKINPNPVSDVLNLEIPIKSSKGYQIVLFDYCGKSLMKQKTTNTDISLDVSAFQSGIYMIRISNLSTGSIITRKIVKQ